MSLKSSLLIAAAAIGLISTATVASAAPVAPAAAVAIQDDVRASTNIEPARWVCGPYGRCVWVRHRPHVHSYYSRPYHAYRPYYGFYRPYPHAHRFHW